MAMAVGSKCGGSQKTSISIKLKVDGIVEGGMGGRSAGGKSVFLRHNGFSPGSNL